MRHRRSRPSPMGGTDEVRILLAELSGRVDSIDEVQDALQKSVGLIIDRLDRMNTSFNEKIENRFRPQWQTWIGMAMIVGGLFGAFWQAGISPLKEGEQIHTSQIAVLDERVRGLAREIMGNFVNNSRFMDYQKFDTDQLRDLKTDIMRLENYIWGPKSGDH